MTNTLDEHAFFDDLKNRIDPSIRAQDDFFMHVNKKWLADNPIPPSESRWGTFYILRDQSWTRLNEICEQLQKNDYAVGSIEQKVRDLYYTGIHKDDFAETHMQELHDEYAKIDAIASTSDLFRYIGGLHRVDIDAAWTLTVDADDKDSTTYVLRMCQDGITLPDRDYYTEDTDNMKEVRDELKKHIIRMSNLIPELGDPATLPDFILNFETELAHHSMTSVEQRDIDASYNPMSRTQLAKRFSGIDWDAYFTGLNWSPKNKVIVNQVAFFEFISEIAKSKSLDEWKTYLRWHVTVAVSTLISEKLSEASFEFFGKVLGGKKEMQPLWRRTVIGIDSVLGYAAGGIYSKKYFPKASKAKVEALVEDVRAAFAERITHLDWMQPETKIYALKKLANMVVLIGYTDDLRDYSNLKIGRESHFKNYLAASHSNSRYHLDKVGGKTRRDELLMTPQTVNAYHDPNQLVIAFPAGILQAPFFDVDAPDVMNYAGIGTVIGHELTHGFDDQGSQFDAEGNVNEWRSESDKVAFDTEADKLSRLADTFEVAPGVFMKGGLVLGEVIADLGGVEISLAAYRKHMKDTKGADYELSDEEIRNYYASYAVCECHNTTEEIAIQAAVSDPHPHEWFRVNGIVQHCDEFYRTFDVTKADKLYLDPDSRARIW